jgi:hypothetical protein
MPFRATQRFIRKQPHGRVLLSALVAAGVLTWWALRTQPPSQLVGQARVGGGASLQAVRAEGHPQRAWTIDLRLDGSLPAPGPRWVLHEGKVRNQGYELHWRPEERVLLLYRTPRTFLLGAHVLEATPAAVRLVRQGGRFEVLVDGRSVMISFDPVGVAEPEGLIPAWSCWTDSSLGDATITVQQRGRETAFGADVATIAGPNPALAAALAQDERDDRPLLAVRQAMAQVESGHSQQSIMAALSQAQITIDPLSVLDAPRLGTQTRTLSAALRRQRYSQANPELGHLRLWLALARIDLALRSDAGERTVRPAYHSQVEVVAAELDELTAIAAASGAPPPELTGVILELLPALCAQAAFHPSYPMSPERVLAQRRPWIALAGQAAVLAQRTGEHRLPEDISLALRLTGHLLGCLHRADGPLTTPTEDWAGAPQPTPVEAPAWLTTRWRAAAGSDPQADRYPDLPLVAGDPVAVAIARLEPACGILPPLAVLGRAKILGKLIEVAKELGGPLFDVRLEELKTACETIPGREGLLARAITALHLAEMLKQDAKRGQVLSDGWLRWAHQGLLPLMRTDPLAYALEDLLQARHPELAANAAVDALQYGKKSDALKRRLAVFTPLLAGDRDAPAFIWIGGVAPAEALIGALAAQETAHLRDPTGATPGADWALLRRLPCLTLPGELLIPAAAHSPGAPGGAESGGPLPP